MGCQDEVVIPQVERPVGDKQVVHGLSQLNPYGNAQLAVEDVPRHPGFKNRLLHPQFKLAFLILVGLAVVGDGNAGEPPLYRGFAEQGNPVAPIR